ALLPRPPRTDSTQWSTSPAARTAPSRSGSTRSSRGCIRNCPSSNCSPASGGPAGTPGGTKGDATPPEPTESMPPLEGSEARPLGGPALAECDRPTRWCGWQRIPPARHFEKVREADSEEACRQALWRVRFTGRRRDVVVLKEGVDPNKRRCL